MSLPLALINQVVSLSHLVGPDQLDRVITALADGSLQPGDGALAIQDTTGLTGHPARELASLLRQWKRHSGTVEALAASLATAQGARQYVAAHQPHIQLVWTGPLEAGVQARSTLLTLQDLIATAQQEIVVVGYTITDGAAPILLRLAEARRRGVQVSLIANRAEQYLETIHAHWPAGAPPPTIFSYPQSDHDQMASLHAKAVVTDGRRMLLTSANLTYHGLGGNIELGILIEDTMVADVVRLIQALIERRIVVPVAA